MGRRPNTYSEPLLYDLVSMTPDKSLDIAKSGRCPDASTKAKGRRLWLFVDFKQRKQMKALAGREENLMVCGFWDSASLC